MEKVYSRNRGNARIARRLLRPSRSSLLNLASLRAIYCLNSPDKDDKLNLKTKRSRGSSNSQRMNLKAIQPSTRRRVQTHGSRTSIHDAAPNDCRRPKQLFEINTLQLRNRRRHLKSQNEVALNQLTNRPRVPPLDFGMHRSTTFQEEFLTKAEEFSQSWREAIGSCTKAVARLVKIECASCKLVELLKFQACRQDCLGNSRKERLLAAEKVRTEIHSALDTLLVQKFTRKHDLCTAEVDALTHQVIAYGEEANALCKQYQSILNEPQAHATSLDARLLRCEERLNAAEDLLNSRAVELCQLTEDAQTLLSETALPASLPDLTSITQLLAESGQAVAELHVRSSRLTQQIAEVAQAGHSEAKRLQSELGSDKLSVHYSYKSLQRKLSTAASTVRDQRASIHKLQERAALLILELQKTSEASKKAKEVSGAELLEVTKGVFASYSHMKHCQEITRNFIEDLVSPVPSIQEKLNTLSQVLS